MFNISEVFRHPLITQTYLNNRPDSATAFYLEGQTTPPNSALSSQSPEPVPRRGHLGQPGLQSAPKPLTLSNLLSQGKSSLNLLQHP